VRQNHEAAPPGIALVEVFLVLVQKRQELDELPLPDRLRDPLAREEGELAERWDRRREAAPPDEDPDGPRRPGRAPGTLVDHPEVRGEPGEKRAKAAGIPVAETRVVLPAVSEEKEDDPRRIGPRRLVPERLDEQVQRSSREKPPLVIELQEQELEVVVDLEGARLEPLASFGGVQVARVDASRERLALRRQPVGRVGRARAQQEDWEWSEPGPHRLPPRMPPGTVLASILSGKGCPDRYLRSIDFAPSPC